MRATYFFAVQNIYCTSKGWNIGWNYNSGTGRARYIFAIDKNKLLICSDCFINLNLKYSGKLRISWRDIQYRKYI